MARKEPVHFQSTLLVVLKMQWYYAILLLASLLLRSSAFNNSMFTVSTPSLVLSTLPFKATFSFNPAIIINDSSIMALPTDIPYTVTSVSYNTSGVWKRESMDDLNFTLSSLVIPHNYYLTGTDFTFSVNLLDHDNEEYSSSITQTIRAMSGALSLTPPVLTMIVAVLTKQVFVALVLGIWLGATFTNNFNPLSGLLRTFDTYLVHVINYDSGHAQVIVFCFLLGGCIGIVQKGGGAQGLGLLVTSWTTTRFRALLAMLFLNFLIFFDDYSAILIVGTTFTNIMSKLFIAKEKTALLIHGVSSTFVSIVPLSSWVGVQIGYIQGQPALSALHDPFVWFLQSIPYRFFPLLWLIFCILNVLTSRDAGPMLAAELESFQLGLKKHSKRIQAGIKFSPMLKLGTKGDAYDRARHSEECIKSDDNSTSTTSALNPKEGTPLDRWYNAAVPFAVVAVSTFIGLYIDGSQKLGPKEAATLVNIISHANSFNALLWGSTFGCLTSLVMLTGFQGILTLGEAMEAWVAGIAENILSPILILLLAWALGQVMTDVLAPEYLADSIGSSLPIEYLPTLVTLLCFLMSFSTGTAFGCMGICFPLVIPLANNLSGGNEIVLSHCVGAVLGGSVFGNVISPIADDSILASMATGISVTDHVESSAPYVIFVGAISVLVCSLPVGLEWYGPYTAIGISTGIICAAIYLFGTDTTTAVDDDNGMSSRRRSRSSSESQHLLKK